MSRLAIVIPAYKSMYFGQALLSIANQTNKDFTLYIGDDCSPGNLYSIVEKYENRIPIIYKHFDENLGGKDLVAQWERCIDLVGDEEWIWLFSDDDLMDIMCVENFYLSLHQNADYDLFHFNVKKVDEFNNPTVTQFKPFLEIINSEEFLTRKLEEGYFSTVVEYIFRKTHFYEQGRFQTFDLAWGSDDATWIKLSKNKGIRTIENSKVYWRSSLINISSVVKDKEIVIRKMNAQIEFTNWIYEKSKHGEITIEDSILQKKLEKWFIGAIQSRIEILSNKMITSLMKKFNLALKKKEYPISQNIFLYIYKVYRFFIGVLKRILFWKFLKLQRQKIKAHFIHFDNMIL